MNFKNFLTKVKAFFVALGLKILAGLKALGLALKSAPKKIWAKIKTTPKKKLITYTLVPVLLFTLCLILVLCSDERTSDNQGGNNSTDGGTIEEVIHYGPKYELLSDGTYCVVGYVFPEGKTDIVLDAVYEKCAVTKIGDRAFADLDNITSIVLPDSIVSIGSYAFSGCDNIESIVIPESVETIMSRAFYDCEKLASIEFKSADNKNAALTIGEFAFSQCNALTSLVIPENVVAIENSAFEGCSAVKSVSLPSTLETLSSRAFYGCSELTTVTFATGCVLDEIKSSAFENCKKLASIELPESIVKLRASVFAGCSSLADIALGSKLESIGSYAFYGCTSLSIVYVSTSGFVSTISFVDAYSNPLKYGATEKVRASMKV